MSMQIQMGPPGSEGAGMRGVGGASPAPEDNAQRKKQKIDAYKNENNETEQRDRKGVILLKSKLNSSPILAPVLFVCPLFSSR